MKVVVTGLGLICPLGRTVQDSWRNLLCSHSGLKLLTDSSYLTSNEQTLYQLKPWIGAPVTFAFPIIHNNIYSTWPRWMQLLLISSHEAIMNAKLNEIINRDRVGICTGTGIGSLEDIIQTSNVLTIKGHRRVSPYFIPKILFNTPAGLLGQLYKWLGPTNTVSTACSTGASALINAAMMIQSGDADVMIVGASEAPLTPLSYAGFSQLKALAAEWPDDSPHLASRPFDKERNGFVMGEGAGSIILESEKHALKRGATIFAEFSGYGIASDAYHITAPSKDGNGAILAMKKAIDKAGISPNMIDYINCHATSTPLGDQIELEAIETVFQSRATNLSLPISSSKGAIGHLLGAAGIVESIFSILSLYDQILPPTLNLHNPPSSNLIDHVSLYSKRPHSRMKYILKNSFGFGGINVSLIFKSNL